MRRAVFPGSFNPATIAHLAIADATLAQCNCDHLTFVLSRAALGKPDHDSSLAGRVDALAKLVIARTDLTVEISDARLIADLADGFDVVVMGADKWAQVLDPQWYDSAEAHIAGLDALPEIALAPRPPSRTDGHPRVTMTVLALPDSRLAHVSSTAVRAGRTEWAATR